MENPARQARPGLPAGPPQFLGYRTTPEGPVFRYRIGLTEITETISAPAGQASLTLTVATVEGKKGTLVLQKKQP